MKKRKSPPDKISRGRTVPRAQPPLSRFAVVPVKGGYEVHNPLKNERFGPYTTRAIAVEHARILNSLPVRK